METVACNLCGSTAYEKIYSMPDAFYFKDEWFNVVACQNCGLGFVNPRPSFAEIFRYYPVDYYDYFQREQAYNDRRYAEQARLIAEATIGKDTARRLFDVGCANGDFPRYMQRLGWQTEACEASPNAAEITDLKVYREEFPQIPVHQPTYDVVTAWAVLEHVHDPARYFRKAAEILKSGGSFIFLVTNFESVSSRHLFAEDVPRHLYFFTERTVKQYLERSGFKLLRADYSDRVHAMRPVNFLRYYFYRYLLRRDFRWEDVPQNRLQYFAAHGLGNNPSSTVRYVVSNPLTVLDRLLVPLFEWYQILSRSYGIVTYIAVKQ